MIDPAMQRKIAFFQSSRNRRMGAQVFQLRDYVLFGEREKKFGARLGVALSTSRSAAMP